MPVVIPVGETVDLLRLGGPSAQAYRNRLLGRWLASQCAAWLESRLEIKSAPDDLPQTLLVVGDADGVSGRVISGNCPFTTGGLGLTPGNQFSLIQAAETPSPTAIQPLAGLGGHGSAQEYRMTDAD